MTSHYYTLMAKAARGKAGIIKETNAARRNCFGDHRKERHNAIRKTSSVKYEAEEKILDDHKNYYKEHRVMFYQFLLRY